jgi:ABC-type phosphate transport system permease subunit
MEGNISRLVYMAVAAIVIGLMISVLINHYGGTGLLQNLTDWIYKFISAARLRL